MMKLTDLTLLALQTAFMQRDLTTQGMCAGAQEQFRDAASKTYNILMFQTLDTMKASEFAHQLADELAWQFHVDYYDKSADIETKKRLVKQSLKIHRTKGTPQAVIDLMEAVFSPKAELNEWFNYGGDPFRFKIKISRALDNNVEKQREFYKALNTVKNVRSVFEGFEFFELILANAVSKIKKNNTVRYTNSVGFFDEYTFKNDEVLSFGAYEKAYSFIMDYIALWYSYTISGDAVTITKYNRTDLATVEIPETIEGKKVVTIGENAFEGHSELVRVVVPKNVAHLNSKAFADNACTCYDFLAHEFVPALSDVDVFRNIKAEAKILVSKDLYTQWVNETNWTRYKSNITSKDYISLDPLTGEALVNLDDVWLYRSAGVSEWGVSGSLRAYYSINGGEKTEITSYSNLFGAGDIYFSYSYTEESLEHYYCFYGSYCYVWNSGTHEIWVEDDSGKIFYHRTLEVV